jgi:hypothetical protein
MRREKLGDRARTSLAVRPELGAGMVPFDRVCRGDEEQEGPVPDAVRLRQQVVAAVCKMRFYEGHPVVSTWAVNTRSRARARRPPYKKSATVPLDVGPFTPSVRSLVVLRPRNDEHKWRAHALRVVLHQRTELAQDVRPVHAGVRDIVLPGDHREHLEARLDGAVYARLGVSCSSDRERVRRSQLASAA